LKEFNIGKHYNSKHKEKYKTVRREKVAALKTGLEPQRSLPKTIH
jgi:hypothetical protein